MTNTDKAPDLTTITADDLMGRLLNATCGWYTSERDNEGVLTDEGRDYLNRLNLLQDEALRRMGHFDN